MGWMGGLQSVHNRSPLPILPLHTFSLLQIRSSPQAAVCQEKISSSMVSSTDYSPVRKICSTMGSPQAAVPSGNIQLLQCGVLHGLPCDYLLWGIPAPAWSLMGWREISAPAPGAFLPLPISSLTLVFTLLFLTFFSSPLPVWHFWPFLNMFSQRHC